MHFFQGFHDLRKIPFLDGLQATLIPDNRVEKRRVTGYKYDSFTKNNK